MGLAGAIASAKAFLEQELGLAATVVAAAPKGDGYTVTLEAIVEREYMRQRAQRDLIAQYEVTLDEALGVTALTRKEVRERGIPTAHG